MDVLVTKSNDLVRASYTLTLNEQRLILGCLATLDPRKPMPKTPDGDIKPIRVTVDEFSATYEISDRSTAYEALRDASDRLYERDVRTFDAKGKARGRFRWVQAVTYHKGQGYVEVTFSQNVAPYVTLLHREFTSYMLKQVSKVNSIYAIRMFELLMQFKSTGMLLLGLDEFKRLLALDDKYDRFSNLKLRVIDPAIKELTNKANLEIRWTAIRDKRRVTSLRFDFKENPQAALDLTS